MARLPYYFYDINSYLPGTPPRKRWEDEFSDLTSDYVDIACNLFRHRERTARNIAYSKWQASFFYTNPDGTSAPCIKPKMFKWQTIRVLSFKHNESNRRDWWENYQDAVFRVFVQPETTIDPVTRCYKQWYILSPEDGYLVNRLEIEKTDATLPEREWNGREKWLSDDSRLRVLRAIPTECCHHLRHETTGGELPEGL